MELQELVRYLSVEAFESVLQPFELEREPTVLVPLWVVAEVAAVGLLLVAGRVLRWARAGRVVVLLVDSVPPARAEPAL